jgi:c-di-GMP-related signal transduction protein
VRSGVTAALLSVVDRLYEAPLADLLAELPMSDTTTRALLHGTGRVGEALEVVRACERNDRTMLETLSPGRSDELLELHDRAVERARGVRPPDHHDQHDDQHDDARSKRPEFT